VAVLRGSRRLTINGHTLRYKGLYTANPANCWLKDDFITSPAPYRRFIQSLPTDNPYLPVSYVAMLKDSFGHRPELLEAYLHGSWDLADSVDQIIKAIWLEQADSFMRIQYKEKTRKYISVDVARYGDNETVAYYFEDSDIIDELIYGQRPVDYTINRITAWSKEKQCCPVIVDEGGVGGGAVDGLSANGVNVIAANSAVKPEMTNQMYVYGNRRAEVWDYTARKFSRGGIELHHKDPMLRKQLCTPRYAYRNGRIFVESKEEIMKRLGHGQSPDRADAYVNGIYYGRNVTETDKLGMIETGTGLRHLIPDCIGV
jgi:phage terminase large subunit